MSSASYYLELVINHCFSPYLGHHAVTLPVASLGISWLSLTLKTIPPAIGITVVGGYSMIADRNP